MEEDKAEDKSVRVPDGQILMYFKDKLHKLDNFKVALWVDKYHLDIFSDFICTSEEKKLFCYLHAVQGDQYKLVVTYKIASVPPVDQVMYLVRTAGYMTPDTMTSMVTLGTCKKTNGRKLQRSMSDLQSMVKRRELVQNREETIARARFQEQAEISNKKCAKNALMPSLSDERMSLPSMAQIRTPPRQPPTLFCDTLKATMMHMRSPRRERRPEDEILDMLKRGNKTGFKPKKWKREEK